MNLASCRKKAILTIAIAVFLLVLIPSSFAQNVNWDTTTGDWSDGSNWDTGSEPTILDTAGIHNGGTVQITSGNDEEAKQLNIGIASLGGVGHVIMTGGTLNAGNVTYVGYNGTSVESTFTQTAGIHTTGQIAIARNSNSKATYTQSGGVVNDTGNFFIGYLSGADGTYHLSGDESVVLDVGGYEYIGNVGKGTFIQQGGQHNVAGELAIGRDPGGQGIYDQSGGTVNAGGHLYLARNTGSSGEYTLSEEDGTAALNVTGNLYVGHGSGGTGTFTHLSGTNTVTGTTTLGAFGSGEYTLSGDDTVVLETTGREYIGSWGTGAFTQTGGTHTSSSSIYLGANKNTNTTGHGTYTLQAGEFTNLRLYVGSKGEGTFTQSGGYHETDLLTVANSSGAVGVVHHSSGTTKITDDGGHYLYVGMGAGSTGTYNLLGDGLLDSSGNLEYIGRSGTGTFNQSGGEHRAERIYLGYYDGSVGNYEHTGGTLDVSYNILIGSGDGATGTYTFKDGNLIGDSALFIRDNVGGTATFQGYGTTNLTGVLRNNGKVIADGDGVERTLDFSNFAGNSIQNSLNNTTDNGWYAVDKGKLALPSVLVAASDITYNWGETPNDTDLDLINSVSMTFRDVVGSGWVDVELLAPDRSDVFNVGPLNESIGYWSINETGFTFSSVDLVFRYDDALLAELGLDIDSLQLIHYDDFGVGTNVLTSVDPVNKLIYAEGVTSFSDFSADAVLPEIPTSAIPIVALSLFGSLFFMRKKLAKGAAK